MEILIAVLILGLLMTTLFTSFNAFMSSSTVVTEDLAQDERIKNLLGQLERDLGTLFITFPPRYKIPETDLEQDPFRFQGIQDEISGVLVSRLEFSSLNHISFGTKNRPGVARIIYYARINDDNQIDLCRSDRLRPFEDQGENVCDPVLLSNISEFELKFVDALGEEHAVWNSESSSFGYTVPFSVKFKITLRSGGSPRIAQTEIALVVTREEKK